MNNPGTRADHRAEIVLEETTIVYDRITGFVLGMDWSIADEMVRRGILSRSLGTGADCPDYFVNACN
jgi:hypothetical protein